MLGKGGLENAQKMFKKNASMKKINDIYETDNSTELKAHH
jgi:hypothetical protein